MRFKTAIFDLDGTLLDTLDDLATSTNHALAQHGYPLRTTAEVRQFVGNGIRNLVRLAVPEGSPDEVIDAVHATFDAHYSAHHLDITAPYPGISELIAHLHARGLKLCVVSNKGDYAVQPLVRHFFGDSFDAVVGEREADGIRRKPWPDTVLACMDKLDSDPCDCVYIGDSEVDIATAENAGIPCITVTWGFRDEEQLLTCGATTIAHDIVELERELLAD